MSLIIPFDFNPVNNDETDTSYTVPAGKYAIVTVTISVSAFGYTTGSVASSNAVNMATSSANATSLELRLKSGEVLTKTESAASGSDSVGSATQGWLFTQGTSIAAALVNSVEVAELRCHAVSGIYDASTAAGITHYASVAGSALVHWHVSEYNNIE